MNRKPQVDHGELGKVMRRAFAAGDSNPFCTVMNYCIYHKLEVPEWVQFSAEWSALSRLMNPTPRTGRHVSHTVRARDYLRDFERWDAVEEIRAHNRPRVSGHRLSLYDVFYEAAAVLAQRFPKDKHSYAAVRRSYFRVKKDPAWYLLIKLALLRKKIARQERKKIVRQLRVKDIRLERVKATRKSKPAATKTV